MKRSKKQVWIARIIVFVVLGAMLVTGVAAFFV